jgi:hypothetical protein
VIFYNVLASYDVRFSASIIRAMMEAVSWSETSVMIYQATRMNVTDDMKLITMIDIVVDCDEQTT